jgi:hypothetical protein
MRLLLLLSALFLPFSLLAEDAPAKILKALPQTAAECERGEVTTYDRPELGASVDYKKAGVVITVYLYDLGKKSIGAKLDDPTLQQAFKMAMSDLKQATKLGYYSNLQEVDAGTAKFGEGRETLRARYRLTREKGTDAGQRFVSEIHVWGGFGQIIKVRMTGDIENEAAHTKLMEKFMPALIDALQKLDQPKVL